MTRLSKETIISLRDMGWHTILDLMTKDGVLASGRNEAYGCIFGRDSLIIAQKLLSGYELTKDTQILDMVHTILSGLTRLQGTAEVPESGEQPGKCIHEWRPDNHERLTIHANPPWYIYPNGEVRNYEGVDETALFLWTMGRYLALSNNNTDYTALLPHAQAAHRWITTYGDSNEDGFTDFAPRTDWTYGGLHIHTWMDSDDSLFHENGDLVIMPVASVEVQAYTYAALRTWQQLTADKDPQWSATLRAQADELKIRFNEHFSVPTADVLASAIDGSGAQIAAVRSAQGHVLWASVPIGDTYDTILDSDLLPALADRLMQPDLFDPHGGIRTLSTDSAGYDSDSYHNGPIWPHDAGIVAEGLARFGFTDYATQIRDAIGKALNALGSPYEYYNVTEGIVKPGFQEKTGHGSCAVQGWAAATLFADMTALLHAHSEQ